MSDVCTSEIVESSEETKYAVFAGLAVLLVLIGIFLTPNVREIFAGFHKLITTKVLLDINMFHVVEGALGVPYINSGLLVLFVLLTYALTKTEIKGGQIAAMFMVLGFGFCGKTILNVWPCVCGVMIYAKRNKKTCSSMMPVAWFSCAISSIFNLFAFYFRFGALASDREFSFSFPYLILAFVITAAATYGVAFFASFLPTKHNGYTLYNAGFAAGVCGFLIFSILKAFGLAHGSPTYDYSEVHNPLLAGTIIILLLYLGVCGFVISKGRNVKKVCLQCKKGGDYVAEFGFGPALVNMCVMGFACLAYLCVAGMISPRGQSGNLSGPVFGALFTVVGFSSNGIAIREALPIYLGIFVTAFLGGGVTGMLRGESFVTAGYAYVGTKSMLIAGLYACGMSPITGDHGPISGFLAAVIHCLIVPNVAVLHGWLNLYQNGFCLGLVTTFYEKICECVKTKK